MRGTAVILTRAAWGSPVFPRKDLQPQPHPFAPFPLQLRETKPRGKPGHALVPPRVGHKSVHALGPQRSVLPPGLVRATPQGRPKPPAPPWAPPSSKTGAEVRLAQRLPPGQNPELGTQLPLPLPEGRSSRALPGTPQWARLPPNLPPTPPPGSLPSPEPLLPQLTAGSGGQRPGSLPRSPEGVCAGEGEALPGLSRFP